MSGGSSNPQLNLGLEESIKPIQWGVTNGSYYETKQIHQNPRNLHTHEQYRINQNYQNYHQRHQPEVGEDGRPFYTEYSQVSAIETGFKKLKSNQIQILKELKREYEVLKNSSVDSKIYGKQKNVSSSSSNLEENSDQQSSQRSEQKSKRKDSGIQREYQMLQLEKKQLEIIINNSMKKIEELLHNQIELKRQIHDLKTKIDGHGSSDHEYEFIVKKMKKNEEDLNQSLDIYKRQVDKLKLVIKQLNENIGHLEGTVAVKDIEIKKVNQDRRNLEEIIRIEKNKYMLLEIDLKKAKMEYQILEKDKKSQMERFLRNGDSKSENFNREYQNTMKRLEDEIQLKDKRYRILMEELEQKRVEQKKLLERIDEKLNQKLKPQDRDRQGQRQAWKDAWIQKQKQKIREIELENEKNKKYVEEMLRKILEEKSSNNSNFAESINVIISKMNEVQHKPTENEQLKSQVQNLKYQMQYLKRSTMDHQNHQQIKYNEQSRNHHQDEQYQNEMSFKIRQLEKVIEDENKDKLIFLEEMKSLQREVRQNKEIIQRTEREKYQLTQRIDRLDRDKNQLDQRIQRLDRENSQLIQRLNREKHQLTSGLETSGRFNNQLIQRLNQDKNQLIQKLDRANRQKNEFILQEERQKSEIILEIERLKYQMKQTKTESKDEVDYEKKYQEYKNEFDRHFKESKEELQRNLWEAKRKEKSLLDEIQRYQHQLDAIKNMSADLSGSQLENNSLKIKLQQFNLMEKQLNNANSEIEKYRQFIKIKEDSLDQDIRSLKRKCDEEEFKAQKAKEEGEFKLNLLKTEHKSEISRSQEEIERLKQIIANTKLDFQQVKISYEKKIGEKSREVESNQGLTLNLEREKLRIVETMKRQFEEISLRKDEKYSNQLNSLIQRVERLTQSNERLFEKEAKYATIEKEVFQMRRLVRNTKSLTETVDHLWQVKEAEYANVHQILKQTR